MVKFTINISKEKEVKEFLQQGDLDFITIIALQHKCFMICDTTDIYTHINFDIISQSNLKDNCVFRISRQKLIGLIVNGMIEFTVDNDLVQVQFLTNEYKRRYGFKCKFQTDLIGKFLRRLEILDEALEYKQVDISQILVLTRFAKSLNTNVRCDGTTACVQLKNISIYKDAKDVNFTCSGKTLLLLSKYTAKVYDVQNYLIYRSEDKAIIVTKYRDIFDSELNFIKSKPTLYTAKFSLGNIIDITRRIKFNTGKFVLDFDNKTASYKEENIEYDIAIEVTDVVDVKNKTKSDSITVDDFDFSSMLDDTSLALNTDKIGTHLPSIILPSETLKSVLIHLGVRSIISVEIKKNFVVLRLNGLYIVFGRKDYVE